MYHILKKHRNRLLAFATAFLMVAFLLPSMNSGGGTDPVIGKAYGEKIRLSDLKRSQFYWNQLARSIYTQDQRPLALTLGEAAYAEINERPELFLLLGREARERGIYITEEAVREQASQMLVPNVDMRKPLEAQPVHAAIRELMMIQESFMRTVSAIRVSEPMRERELAAQLQEMRLTAVDFPAAEFEKSVTAPTQEEMQKHFDTYKDKLPIISGPMPRENPFGFGYRFPNRAQVQYISIPQDAVRKAVEATRTPERWRIDARRHYLQNKQAYSITTQPATQPGTTQPATQPIQVLRPFEEVAERAIEAVIAPEIEKTVSSIVSRVNSTLTADFAAYRADKKATTSLGVPYESYEYLQKLAESIQKEFNVLPQLGDSGEVLADYEMNKLGPIAQSRTSAGIPFPNYAVMTEDQRRELISRIPTLPPTLDMLQPSQALRDNDDNVYIFRRSALSPAHTPKDITEVAQRIEQDLRKLKAFELAQKAAADFVKAAESQGIEQAAKAANRTPVKTDFIPNPQGLAMGLHLSDAGTPLFTTRAIARLLEERAKGQEHPIAAIPVERDGRVIVARMDELRSNYQQALVPLYTSMIDRQIMSEMAGPIVSDWFDFKTVSKRTNYEPEEMDESDAGGDSAPTPPVGPIQL